VALLQHPVVIFQVPDVVEMKIVMVLWCLEKYFEMNKKNCREALNIYKKFLARMDRVCEFLKVAEVCTNYFVVCVLYCIGFKFWQSHNSLIS